MSLLAVDMGSSSCKAVAFSEDGTVLAHAAQSYSGVSRRPSWSEMPPETFWRALLNVTQSTSRQLAHDPAEVLAISSHGETFFPVNTANQPIAPAILNSDNRAVAETSRLAQEIGRKKIFEITGLAAHPMYPLPKILWLRRHQPEIFSLAARFLSLPGFLLSQLGMPAYVDYSLASRFLAFDIRKKTWSSEILSACNLLADRLPQPVPAGTIAGNLSVESANALGLAPGTPVVLGGHDQPCAALGSGVIDQGRISASLGTYECLVAASETPALSNGAFAASLNSYCHVVPNRYVTIAYFPSGIMIDWLVRLLHPEERGSVGRHEFLSALEAQASSSATGLCITPHLLGTCNPDFDPAATGVIAGIRPTARAPDLYQGILEGVACEFATMAELLEEAAGKYQDVYISGGGGRSQLGLSLRSAIANRNLHRMRCEEAVCLGTAILAGVAVGKYSSISAGIQQAVRISETIAPDPSVAASYRNQKAQYHLLYSSLAPVRQAQRELTQEGK